MVVTNVSGVSCVLTEDDIIHSNSHALVGFQVCNNPAISSFIIYHVRRRMPFGEQELPTLQEHPVSGIHVAQAQFSVQYFVDYCLHFYPFSSVYCLSFFNVRLFITPLIILKRLFSHSDSMINKYCIRIVIDVNYYGFLYSVMTQLQLTTSDNLFWVLHAIPTNRFIVFWGKNQNDFFSHTIETILVFHS